MGNPRMRELRQLQGDLATYEDTILTLSGMLAQKLRLLANENPIMAGILEDFLKLVELERQRSILRAQLIEIQQQEISNG